MTNYNQDESKMIKNILLISAMFAAPVLYATTATVSIPTDQLMEYLEPTTAGAHDTLFNITLGTQGQTDTVLFIVSSSYVSTSANCGGTVGSTKFFVPSGGFSHTWTQTQSRRTYHISSSGLAKIVAATGLMATNVTCLSMGGTIAIQGSSSHLNCSSLPCAVVSLGSRSYG